ncbi:hypothetical protein [Companilactobacillus bobalius]|uniref:Uncharacterized protein n=2 Tax=Companilactobacillus bobalius TaxID=2801451 RepID=A0A202F7W9_9LACO|nr:hypothetical protein [Companilactobacillus bobalius]GEO58487.1 hypothetical protein LBO01_16160 [Companilactobacillus paralimentarius]KAE9557566.1 hypothetical protein ATN92_15540 [Companilactobacillus bobalius]KAE9563712.1 hypothetical protein ATN92_02990 [Companilactobacillus bobalius]KRK83456.1 hypothetical protein FC78_GL001412 [Companilactobacillus bobalius DSM 19674]OVE96537.1 hypothetical protein LKACC16343_02204 [Companilactobacillus bobalius]
MKEISLTPESIKELATEIINISDKKTDNERGKELRNVKILLVNYRYLQNHLDVKLPEIDIDGELSRNQLSLYALLGYRERSREMMEFVNEVLGKYKKICMSGNDADKRKFGIIDGLYLSEKRKSKQWLCEYWNIDDSTLRRDQKKAFGELKVMLFGIDSLNDISR